ncbi:MAG: class I SAM-dependent methyltransferase [Clostridium sp.]|nr:class I SAM-dependent methyltransferase [Clostridium sp.]
MLVLPCFHGSFSVVVKRVTVCATSAEAATSVIPTVDRILFMIRFFFFYVLCLLYQLYGLIFIFPAPWTDICMRGLGGNGKKMYLCSIDVSPLLTLHKRMDTLLLAAGKDPMGRAIHDYHTRGRSARLRVFSPQFDEDEMPVATLFRTPEQMPPLERRALDLCRGRVLDVGAGAGCHSLALQAAGLEVTAIDISALAVETMRARGVRDARQADLFGTELTGRFDTVVMLMNGSGIIGRLERMPAFFHRMKQLLAPGGSVLMDSTDLRYIFEDEDGALDIDLNAGYYGELDFSMQCGRVKGDSFPWLYVDFDTLSYHARANGFRAERVERGAHYDYLARLWPAG